MFGDRTGSPEGGGCGSCVLQRCCPVFRSTASITGPRWNTSKPDVMTVLARYPGSVTPATEEIALSTFRTAAPARMTNRAEPGSGTDQRTVPGDVQSLGPSGQVSTEEPADGEAAGGGAAQPTAIVTAATATAVHQTRSRRCMSLTPPDVVSHN